MNVYAESGAAPNRWRAILKGLSKLDVDMLLAVTSGYKSIEEKDKYGKSGILDNTIKYTYCSVQNNYKTWRKRINFYLLSGVYFRINSIKVRKIIKNFKPQVIYFSPTLDVFRIIARLSTDEGHRFKLMMDITEFSDVLGLHATNHLQRLVLKRFNYFLVKKIFPVLDFCLVITDKLRIHYSQIPGINPNISFLKVPIIVDFERFDNMISNRNNSEPYIAYCGSSSFSKDGVDILIKSFKCISEEFPDLKLKIAAFWELDGQKMVELIRENGLEDRIIYLGALNRDEIPLLVKGAKVLVLPRPDSRQAQGGFPTKLGEYLASGNPVCVTKVSEIPDYLVDNESAFIAEPGDIKSFSDAMRRALSDEKNAKRIGENGKKIAELHFDKDYQAKRIIDFIESNIIK
jgi:glycosyltransferase involved in cell wall biosynthesis